MQKIADLKQFSEVTANFRRAKTNFLMMPAQITELCERGALSYSEKNGFLKFLCDRGDYFNFYYYALSESEPDVSDVISGAKGKDVLIDIVSSKKTENPVISKLIINGDVEPYKIYKRMSFDMSGVIDDTKLNSEYSEDGRFNAADVIALYRAALDERSTPLPSEDELNAVYQDGRLAVVYDKSGQLCAACMLEIAGKSALIQHVVVSENDRRHGLAGFLVSKAMLLAKELGIKSLRLWVDMANQPAVLLYESKDFTPDGVICDQYILKKEK